MNLEIIQSLHDVIPISIVIILTVLILEIINLLLLLRQKKNELAMANKFKDSYWNVAKDQERIITRKNVLLDKADKLVGKQGEVINLLKEVNEILKCRLAHSKLPATKPKNNIKYQSISFGIDGFTYGGCYTRYTAKGLEDKFILIGNDRIRHDLTGKEDCFKPIR